jgi:lysophospholipase L1-like esterase
MSKICIFGDSIAWGYYDPDGGGWADRLKNYYVASDKDVDVYNLGISGDHTGKLLKRLEAEIEARVPEIIIFAIGINDSKLVHSEGKNGVIVEEFRSNLDEIMEIARKQTDKIIFVGLTDVDESKTDPIPWNLDRSYKDEYINQYEEVLENFCKENNVSFIKLAGLIKKGELHDGLHPNTSGHIKIFEKVRDYLDNVL